LKVLRDRPWLHPLLLGTWLLLGIVLRFTGLTAKPIWTDEFATLVFSLGNSFQTVPLDQVITIEQLLEPLRPNPEAGMGTVVHNLLTESNHPPLYYILTHLWLKLFPADDGLVSLWGARSLAALFGAAAIPAVFGLAWIGFRSGVVAQFAAVLMAVSPFAIYLAQEVRHYTLVILWITASLSCLIVAIRSICNRTSPPLWLCFSWIVVNCLGMATHYLFLLTLMAEGLTLLGLAIAQIRQNKGFGHLLQWWRIGLVAVGTLAGVLVWLPYLHGIQDSELTQWIERDGAGFRWKGPITQSLAGWTTMLYLLPIQAEEKAIWLTSAVLMVLLVIWTVPKMRQGLRPYVRQPETRLSMQVLGGFVLTAIFIFLFITYAFGKDLTVAFRYNFVFFPAVIVLLGAGLAGIWETGGNDRTLNNDAPSITFGLGRWLNTTHRRTAILILLLSFLGAVMVLSNLGYQKTHRPDIVMETIEDKIRRPPIMIAIAHQTHGQTGRMMGLAWEFKHHMDADQTPRFLLARQYSRNPTPAYAKVQQILMEQPRPLEVWLVNFNGPRDSNRREVLKTQNCDLRSRRFEVDGYQYWLYRCRRIKQQESVSE
jgi:uncharacterized membrane protein